MKNHPYSRYTNPVLLITILLVSIMLNACSSNTSSDEPNNQNTDHEEIVEAIAKDEQPGVAEQYCLGLGYIIGNGQDEICDSYVACYFPDGSDCRVEEFYKGRCGQEYTFCQQQGYEIQSWGSEPRCNFPDGSFCTEWDFFNGDCKPVL